MELDTSVVTAGIAIVVGLGGFAINFFNYRDRLTSDDKKDLQNLSSDLEKELDKVSKQSEKDLSKIIKEIEKIKEEQAKHHDRNSITEKNSAVLYQKVDNLIQRYQEFSADTTRRYDAINAILKEIAMKDRK
jgi:biopolymer transport protein ExbB/TolQ